MVVVQSTVLAGNLKLKPPAPAGATDATGVARPLQKRVLDHNCEAASLLDYLKTHGSGTPKRVVEFIQASWALTDALSHHPVGDAWKTKLDEMQRAINDIRKDTNELTARTEDPVRTYAQAAARAPPPCHHQSTHGSNSTAPARPADLDRERAVTVKVGDSAMARNLRRLTNEDLVKRAEKHRRNAAYKAVRPTLASIQFVARKSCGQVTCGSSSAVPRKRRSRAPIGRTGSAASARRRGSPYPRGGVVASDMPCKALGPLTDEADRKRIAQELVANNRHAWGESCEIVHVSWLVRPPPGKKTSSIVIEFTTPHHANKAIDAGTVWDFRVSENTLYDRASRIIRCNNCQRYGHIGNICPHDTICGACAGKHETRACQDRNTPRLVPKCANCNGDHTAWYKKCEVYQQEREKAQGRAMHRPRYHRTPAYLQDPDGSATGSAALGSSSAESRTETGSEISGGLPVGARAAPRADNVGSGKPSAAARDAPDDSAIEGLRFTGNTPPQTDADPPFGTLTTESTLTSVPTLPPTLPGTT
ncbi:unnamed protein product [Aspergillus oryzae var. brunneus]|uniref:Unnamed protein product n=1 Tax=Aspergillus oryzae var. brunneus TaxID=332754 RepID=A0ABQ6LFD4_ASPOZ|nr:unnamed protein product [Aspergillus oryzae var. brunneus]